jgi:phosphohistidine phosphatase
LGRELLILRHGKSDWPAGIDDFDRPLKKRGKLASARIGRWLRDNDLLPDRVLTSTAKRAIDTTRRVCEAMGIVPDEIEENPDLYHAEPETLVAILRRQPESAKRVLIVGHNPGLEELLEALADTPVSPYDDTGRMPAGALAVLRLPGAWPETAPGTASVVTLIRPRELPPVD